MGNQEVEENANVTYENMGGKAMKKWTSFFFALAILAGLLSGCAGSLQDMKIKCPKCGTFFSTQEGAKEFERMRPDDRR